MQSKLTDFSGQQLGEISRMRTVDRSSSSTCMRYEAHKVSVEVL